jgi:hypothetical protein
LDAIRLRNKAKLALGGMRNFKTPVAQMFFVLASAGFFRPISATFVRHASPLPLPRGGPGGPRTVPPRRCAPHRAARAEDVRHRAQPRHRGRGQGPGRRARAGGRGSLRPLFGST